MKQITNKTILKQEDKTYQPIEVDGVIYWMDKRKLCLEGQFSISMGKIGAYKQEKEPRFWDNGCHPIIAQSQSKLDGIPVVSLDSYVENISKSKIPISNSENPWLVGEVQSRRINFIEGFKSNPNQYTQADIEKAFDMGAKLDSLHKLVVRRHKGDVQKAKEELLEQINSISVIEVDEQFNVIGYDNQRKTILD
jgi:hypothetical protein